MFTILICLGVACLVVLIEYNKIRYIHVATYLIIGLCVGCIISNFVTPHYTTSEVTLHDVEIYTSKKGKV